MANFNRIVLLGNLTRDPQLKYLPSQMAVVEFGLAVNHKFKGRDGQDREDILFIECACFGKGAEVINQYVQKGRPLLVEGRLKFETWEDKQGGGKRSKHTVVVENFQLLGSRSDNPGGGGGGGGGGYDEAGGGAPRQSRPAPQQSRPPQRAPQGRAPQQNAPEPPFGDEPQFTDDDIPF